MITIPKKLDMSPHGIPQVINVSQYDSDFSIQFKLYASVGTLTIESGTTAEIRGTKGSGTGYSASATLNTSNGTVTVAGSEQMTAVAGRNTFEIVLKKSGKVLGSANFVLLVERAALDADTITDASVLRELNAIIEGAETATQAAEEAEAAADRAEAAAQSLVIDSTPTQGSSRAVSSGGVYEAISKIHPGLSAEAKRALLACFTNVIWKSADGATCVDELRTALEISDRRPELPSAYEQVEFIKGSGTQYINTGLLSQIPFRAEAKLSYSVSETRVLSGTASTIGNTRFYLFGYGYFGSEKRIGSRFGDNAWMFDSNFVPSIDTPYELSSGINHAANNKASVFLTGEGMSANATINVPTVGNPITIMKFAGETECAIGVALYEIRFYSSETLLFDGIPCYRKSDGKTGLFDAVTNQFFANSGTGEFILGDIIK
ncbi:MAG: hypothetical protein IKD59_09320 [Lachnospiraceae bacterium]|nr:hypothetical protein [Lachnospiraceae bacterium]